MKRLFLLLICLYSSHLCGFNPTPSLQERLESVTKLSPSAFAGTPLFNHLQSMKDSSINGAPDATYIINKLQSPLFPPQTSLFSPVQQSYSSSPHVSTPTRPYNITVATACPPSSSHSYNSSAPYNYGTSYVAPEEQSFLIVQSSWNSNSDNQVYSQRAQRYERNKNNLWDERSQYYYVPEDSRYGSHFNNFCGNGVQQIFHEEMVDIVHKVNRIEHTPSKTKRLSNQFFPMIDALLLHADNFNDNRSYQETQEILDCSHGLSNVLYDCNLLENHTDRPFGFLEATKATLKGGVQGAVNGATNLALFGAIGTIPYAQPALSALMILSLATSLIPEACSTGYRIAKAAYLAVEDPLEFSRRYDAWQTRHHDTLNQWWNRITGDPAAALYSGTAFAAEQATMLFGTAPFNSLKDTVVNTLTKKAQEYGVDKLVQKCGGDRVASSVRNGYNKVKSTLSPTSCSIVNEPIKHSRQKVAFSENIQNSFRRVRPKDDYKAEIEWAPLKWEEIRKLTDDVEKIAQNTGWPKNKIQKIKNHLFYSKHILDEKIDRFDPNHEIASAWDRLYKGDFIENDIKLLKHEYMESRYERLYKTTYRKAHEKIKKRYPWDYPE